MRNLGSHLAIPERKLFRTSYSLLLITLSALNFLNFQVVSSDLSVFGENLSNSPDNTSFSPIVASNFQEKGAVVVQVNLTYQVKTIYSYPNTVQFWVNQFENHCSTTQPGVAPIQKSELVSSSYNLMNTIHQIDYDDVENNWIEYFEFNITENQVFQYSAVYRIRLAHLEWDIKDDISENADGNFLSAYNQSGVNVSDPWYQRLIQSENNLEANNSELTTLTYSICQGKSTLQEKIEAILQWLKENIAPEPTEESQGAYQTYIRKIGDCSDYTTLFVTMLRILKVPARKISGIQILPPSGSFYPFRVGNTFKYTGQKIGDYQYHAVLPGHAWAEYYHPYYGFITIDPTFARTNPQKYTNYIGYHYLTSSIGENYYEGIEPELPKPVVGWGVLPYIKAQNLFAIRWNYSLEVEVKETMGYFWIPKPLHDLLPIIITIPLTYLLVFIIYRFRKKKKNNL